MIILKWILLALVYFIGALPNQALGLYFKNQYRESTNWIATFVENQIIYGFYFSLKFHVYLFAGILLFERDYDFWLIKWNWYCYDRSFISVQAVLYGASLLAVLFLGRHLLLPQSNLYLKTFGIAFEQIFIVLISFLAGALTINSSFVWYCRFVVEPWQSPIPWLPTAISLGLRWFAIVSVPALVINILSATVACGFFPWMIFRVARVVMHMLGPFFFPWRYVKMASHNPRLQIRRNEQSDPPLTGQHRLVRIVSDTHIAHPNGNVIGSQRSSPQTVAAIARLARDGYPMVHVGDVTDTGTVDAWRDALQGWAGIAWTAVVVGNHDVNFSSVVRNDDEDATVHQKRSDGTCAHWEHHLAEMLGEEKIEFPYIKRVPNAPILFLALDSNRRSSSIPITNAFGLVGRDQLLVAEEKLRLTRQQDDLVIVLLHHHVLQPPHFLKGAFLRCFDAGDVLHFAMRARVAAIIHGHKHMPYVCRVEYENAGHSFYVVSCGSAHHDPTGPFSEDVGSPSCYDITFNDSAIHEIVLRRIKDGELVSEK